MDETYASVGYVANAPDQLLGFSAMTVGSMWGGWGLYVDAKFPTSSPEDEESFDPDRTTSEVRANDPLDQVFQRESTWRSFNAAVMRALGGDFAVYAGAGITREKAYDEFQSDEDAGTAEAFYWVRNEVESGRELNLLGGILFRATHRLSFQFGANSNPTGFTAGAALSFPLGG